MGEPTVQHVHTVEVWQLTPTGAKMYPVERFDTLDSDEVPALRVKAEAAVKRLKKLGLTSNLEIEVSEADVTTTTIKMRLYEGE
jgi:hypothetical protein